MIDLQLGSKYAFVPCGIFVSKILKIYKTTALISFFTKGKRCRLHRKVLRVNVFLVFVTSFVISDQCFHSILLENTRKPSVFCCFQGVYDGKIEQKWVKTLLNLLKPFSQVFSATIFFTATLNKRRGKSEEYTVVWEFLVVILILKNFDMRRTI